VLRLDGIGIHDNFFQIGGDSLLAVQVLARVRQVFNAALEMLVFFEAPTIAGMAAALESGGTPAADSPGPGDQSIARLIEELEQMPDEQVEAALAAAAESDATVGHSAMPR
jgi:hypothetical protein